MSFPGLLVLTEKELFLSRSGTSEEKLFDAEDVEEEEDVDEEDDEEVEEEEEATDDDEEIFAAEVSPPAFALSSGISSIFFNIISVNVYTSLKWFRLSVQFSKMRYSICCSSVLHDERTSHMLDFF